MTSEFIHPSKSIEVIQIDHGQKVVSRENVVSETSVSLTVNGNEWFNFLCTPMDLDSLAAGFLFSSQIIRSRDEIKALKVGLNGCGMDVWLSHAVRNLHYFRGIPAAAAESQCRRSNWSRSRTQINSRSPSLRSTRSLQLSIRINSCTNPAEECTLPVYFPGPI